MAVVIRPGSIVTGLETVLSARAIAREQPIAFVARPEPDAVTFALTLLGLGRPIVPLHARWTPRETETALATLSDAVFADAGELLEAARRAPACGLRKPRDEDLAAIVFTSGSGGAPKSVQLTHGAFVASANASAANLAWQDGDRWLLALPFAHIGGLSVLTRCAFAEKPIVLGDPEPEAMLEAISRHRVSLLSLVPTQLQKMLRVDRYNRLSQLRAALIGGSHFGAELRREAADRGIVALASYGLTESCSQAATQRLSETRDPKSLDSGRPLDGVEIRIRNERIELRGPMLMRGYAGSSPLARDEFFSTGDLGALDDEGRLHVLGRADDVIVSGGENVHPAEIERVCAIHPEVTGALAFGMPDPLWGEIVALAIALAPGAAIESVLARLHDELADFKRPRRVVVVDTLPLGPSGKPDRRRARAELSAATRAIS